LIYLKRMADSAQVGLIRPTGWTSAIGSSTDGSTSMLRRSDSTPEFSEKAE
jgi:hypothetical protein